MGTASGHRCTPKIHNLVLSPLFAADRPQAPLRAFLHIFDLHIDLHTLVVHADQPPAPHARLPAEA